MAKTAIGTATQSATENATTAPVVITPLSYFVNGAVSVLLSRLDGAESRTVHGETIVVFPNELLNATSEQLEAAVQEMAKSILFSNISLPNGETKSVADAAKWFCTTLQRGKQVATQFKNEMFRATVDEVIGVKERYASFVNFNDLTDKDESDVALVTREEFDQAEAIQAFFIDNGLNRSRGDYLAGGVGSIWTLNKYGVVLS